MPHGTHLLAKKLGTFMQLSTAETRRLAALQAKPVRIKAGGAIVREGESSHLAYILQSGWACSFNLLPGGGRQIITFPLPGDCIGLRSVLLRTSDHSFSALTDVTICGVDGERTLQTFAEFPRLGAAILWAASRYEAMVVEHLVSIGRRTAIERTAHYLSGTGRTVAARRSGDGAGLHVPPKSICPR